MTERHHSTEEARRADTGTIPEWWRRLNDRGRRRYLAAHPGSRFRGSEVRTVVEKMSPKAKADTARFVKTVARKGGPLAAVAESKLKLANIPKATVPVIANLLRAANGDTKAAAQADRDLARLDAINKPVDGQAVNPATGRPRTRGAYEILQEYKERLGRMPTSEELRTGGHATTTTAPRPAAAPSRAIRRNSRGAAPPPPMDQPIPRPTFKDGKGAPAAAPGGGVQGAPVAAKPARTPKQYEERARSLTLGSVGMLVIGAALLASGGVPVGVFTPELIGEALRLHYESSRRKREADAEARTSDDIVSDYLDSIKQAFLEGFNEKQVEDSLMVTKRSGSAA